MILTRITARNFRNLADTPIDFHRATNLVVGRNGQGKTNLLEAIYFLATTKSPQIVGSAAMLCQGQTCSLPVTTPEALGTLLEERAAARP